MSANRDSQHQWLQEVVQPKLETLSALCNGTQPFDDFDLQGFLKGLLEDLEHINLDDSTVEMYVEKIIDGAKALQNPELKDKRHLLKDFALNSSVAESFDRFFYPSFWTAYQPLLKRNPDLSHASILNAFRLKYHLKGLLGYISESLQARSA